MIRSDLKVLIIDDEIAVVEALRLLFELHGIGSLSASSPDEALAAAALEEVGAVIQDMNFGPESTSGEEGIRLFRALRKADPDLPILIITAWVSLETAVQLVKEGASDYLAKPWEDDKLVTTVRNLLEMRRLRLENRELHGQGRRAREALAERFDLCGIVYESEALHRIVTLAVNVSGSDAPVLITGPSGAGKEKVAEIIQANSRRSDRPFVRVNVGALPADLLESELFGSEPGAYTGAKALRVGRFEAADGGTLFLDEIDALPLAGQVKLLRVVQSGEYQRLGSSMTRRADVRLISATNADLMGLVSEGRFREDLFYRLNVIELDVPPLDDRPEDVIPLARHFLRASAGEGNTAKVLGPRVEEALLRHAWGGNVRELENRIRRAVLTSPGDEIDAGHLDIDGTGPARPGAPDLSTAEAVERKKIEQALVQAGGIVSRAAQELGLSRQALYRRMDRLGITLERRPRL
ncbi:MAG TPA: sigma-54 dependent transcriptional regulator [Candidatus Saccharimonadales bacterium]|nr:sigma-54 dependent transcriptional regulator [Candidatus Saccharimonadales bacterium]